VTVNYAVTGGTASGGGVDYTLAGGTLTFNPGDITKNISITIVNDALDENDETIVVTLSSPSNATLGTNTVHTYTILDNDPHTLTIDTLSFTGRPLGYSGYTTPGIEASHHLSDISRIKHYCL
jgi:hypothetical protein